MNERYFLCETCKEFISAAYKWGYWELEHPGVVTRLALADVQRVLATASYWEAPEEPESDWLRRLLPEVRTFLLLHEQHGVTYAEEEDLFDTWEQWLERGPSALPSPRYFAEVCGYDTWADVLEFMRREKNQLWWWYDEDNTLTTGRLAFEAAVERRRGLKLQAQSPFSEPHEPQPDIGSG